MTLCTSIDTLAMTYLDDELAGEERRELELHLHDCAQCRKHVDDEREELQLVRGKLAAPPASDVLRARIARALDAEDVDTARVQRRRWSQWMLPGSAVAVAAAALFAFVTVKPGGSAASVSPVAEEALRQHSRAMPLEVQGASTGPWLAEHFTPRVAVPRFTAPGARLIGARLTAVQGHDAALLSYEIRGDNVQVVAVSGVADEDVAGGQDVAFGNRTLHVFETDRGALVTFVDANHIAYAFTSDQLSAGELLDTVVSSDLIERAQQGR